MKHTMYYKTGGGDKRDGGEWEVKETEKTIVFTCIKEPFFSPCCPLKMITRKDNKSRHCLRVLEDSYVVYPDRSGTPHIFEKVVQ